MLAKTAVESRNPIAIPMNSISMRLPPIADFPN
jgi:hypothetical protein